MRPAVFPGAGRLAVGVHPESRIEDADEVLIDILIDILIDVEAGR